jgi:hypothetical protein
MTGGLVRCEHCGQKNRVPAAAAGTPRCGKCHEALPWIADADDATFGEVAEAAKIPVGAVTPHAEATSPPSADPITMPPTTPVR